jgi:hypothetical protein
MKRLFFFAAAVCVICSGPRARSAEKADPQKSLRVEPLYRELQDMVHQFYPLAVFTTSYDEKTQTEKIHFEYNTMWCFVRVARKNEPGYDIQRVRGPFVGGIWCDATLEKGRYTGTLKGVEEGVMNLGPDFYSFTYAPYSKKLDQRLSVVLRYPGETPAKFLNPLQELFKDFERHVETQKKSDPTQRPVETSKNTESKRNKPQ